MLRATTKKTVQAHIFDCDGSILNNNVYQLLKEQSTSNPSLDNIIKGNLVLFEHICSLISLKNPDMIDILCGSNRQSHNIDEYYQSYFGTPSFYPILIRIRDTIQMYHTKVSLDPILLADIFSDLPAGTAFTRATTDLDLDSDFLTPEDHPQIPFEKNKNILTYTLIHHLASKHEPSTQLEIHFYDAEFSVTQSLFIWLHKNKALIPENVAFVINHYKGELSPPSFPPIQGTGEIDRDYRKTAKILTRFGKSDSDIDWGWGNSSPKIVFNEELTLDILKHLQRRGSTLNTEDLANQEDDVSKSTTPSAIEVKVVDFEDPKEVAQDQKPLDQMDDAPSDTTPGRAKTVTFVDPVPTEKTKCCSCGFFDRWFSSSNTAEQTNAKYTLQRF